ncbi:hypothetical protein PCE1_005006 [Barthelona sp. PCE]
MSICKLQFRVHGRVQGVFFRKYTKQYCDKHNIPGWVMNDADGTVCGEAYGTKQTLRRFVTRYLSRGSRRANVTSVDEVYINVDDVPTTSFHIHR